MRGKMQKERVEREGRRDASKKKTNTKTPLQFQELESESFLFCQGLGFVHLHNLASLLGLCCLLVRIGFVLPPTTLLGLLIIARIAFAIASLTIIHRVIISRLVGVTECDNHLFVVLVREILFENTKKKNWMVNINITSSKSSLRETKNQ